MASRWEKQVLQRIVAEVDPEAVGGSDIRQAGLEPLIFESRPELHGEPTARACREVYESLRMAAHTDGRLAAAEPLVKNWTLTADIYSPKLRRFIEVDEVQHFSKPRLVRLVANRLAAWAPLYAPRFWEVEVPRLLRKPKRDLDPPHRDEARAYLDELRERLPFAYGLSRTIRLDEFTLAAVGLDQLPDLIFEILQMEK